MKKPTNLTELLCQVKDKRRKQGTRHELPEILLTVIISTMSGYYGYRAMEDFCKRYEKALEDVLGNPKHGVASYSCIRRVLIDLDFNVLSHKFNQWIRGKISIRKKEWLQIDGKGLKGTITDYETKHQNFINLVSLFMNRTGIVLMAQTMNNKEESEINIVRNLIDQLKLKGVVLSMDALHCQKKHFAKLLSLKMNML